MGDRYCGWLYIAVHSVIPHRYRYGYSRPHILTAGNDSISSIVHKHRVFTYFYSLFRGSPENVDPVDLGGKENYVRDHVNFHEPTFKNLVCSFVFISIGILSPERIKKERLSHVGVYSQCPCITAYVGMRVSIVTALT